MSGELISRGVKDCGYDILVTYRKPSHCDYWTRPECTEYRAEKYLLDEDKLWIGTKNGMVLVMVNSDMQTIEISEKEISNE